MSSRGRIVRVPASSGNLGAGFDVLGAALSIYLEVEVVETGEFSIDPGGPGIPADRSNLIVSSFERLHTADGLRFTVRNDIPLARGLGSSAAAILAGLMAADSLFELGLTRDQIFAQAVAIEGHPDNVAAALYGGITVCSPPGARFRETPPDPILTALGEAPPVARIAVPARLSPPEGVEPLVVIPSEEVSTEAARAAMPEAVPGRRRRPQRRRRRSPRARNRALRPDPDRARPLRPPPPALPPPALRALDGGGGSCPRPRRALGATISGAGPTVLVWSYWQSSSELIGDLAAVAGGWAEVVRAPFSPLGAEAEILGA